MAKVFRNKLAQDGVEFVLKCAQISSPWLAQGPVQVAGDQTRLTSKNSGIMRARWGSFLPC